MSEEWKWVEGYEGLYKVSNLGRIKSYHKHKNGYILSIQNQNGDYLRVVLLNINKVRKSFAVHAVVASTFVGQIPAGWQVHHIDGCKQNNIASNLEIIQPKEHRKETKKQNPQITDGMVNYNRFIRPKVVLQYTLDGVFVASYPNAKEAGFATGICSRNILQVASETPYNTTGKTRKQAGGYVWRFQMKTR